ncbi:DUF6316 family protein [Simiduia agarivorans]|uniref:DUF6316 domain-containing protein n=1 Tax=Simiduia agarivorans (strain DSM 21679 / JCM 13881 / BCRC 17597 / SA1) TaxID=1117647 RepID=K4KP29_SIMAS|nr:DUF6316 family protein [Simiduia agarivorans]AFU99995.1 hypothetical protein M5M_14295 [Simiduia agarivorans SA1 = DSM 21679]
MSLQRIGEQGNIPNRNERFFKKDDYWYYNTREGVAIGPFDSLGEARTGASEFIDFIMGAGAPMVETLTRYGRHAA